MAYITPIGSNPEQIEYRLSQAHGCGGAHGTDRQFSYHVDARERPLRWIGGGLAEVDIDAGSVLDESQFDTARALMAGRDPRTGEVLVDAKRAVADDAKVSLGPLVRTVEQIAAEADVSTAEVLGHNKKLVDAFARAQRAVASRGEAARLRADEAGRIADAADVSVEQVWGETVYEQAATNLWETVQVRQSDGSVVDERRPRRVIVGNAGYDASITLPKSYSWLTAIADEDTAVSLEQDIFMRNAERGFGWLESTTAYGMRGGHGRGQTAETVPGSGFLGWSMVHRAARPTNGAEVGDPHWHVHFTIANMTRGSDGRWSTVAAGGRDLMRHAPALDHLVKALVRHDLHQQYGVEYYRNERTGAWEVAGIGDETLRQFSKRDADIQDMLARLGYDQETISNTEKRILSQRTRGRKGEATAAADATLRQLWQDEEREAGRYPQAQRRAVFGHGPGGDDDASSPPPPDDGSPTDPRTSAALATPSVADIAAQLLDPEHGLTAHSRRFTRADALARVADALPYGCSSAQDLETLTDQVLAAAGFRELPEYGRDVDGPNGQRQHLAAGHMANASTYTTQDVVDSETVILRTAKASHADQLDTRVSEDVLALGTSVVEAQHHPLDNEQQAALRRLVTHGYGLDTVTGRPGSGKTTLMRAVRTVYEAAGFVVAGAATAAVAAQNLETESGITSRTVASYIDTLRGGTAPLRGVDVLVIDEANLTEDRDRAGLYRHAAETGTKIVEVGDGKQLRGVGIGSLFDWVHEIVGGAELRNNRRQAEEDEKAAIEAFRDGRYVEAFSIWHGNGRFHATDKNEDATAAMVAHWWRQRQGAPDEHTEMRGLAMLAATNAQVHRLNSAAQAVRLAEDELGDGRTYDVAGGGRLRVHVGDHILVRINDRAGHRTHGPPVLNGYRAVVRDIDERGSITAEWQRETRDGLATETAQLSADYVAIGGVQLGYGLTVHKAEGLTVGGDQGRWQRPDGEQHFGRVLFHAPGADNPASYVALSRHRQQVDLFGSLDQLETEQQRYLLGPPRTADEIADRAIERLAEHARATETHGDDRPVVADLGLAEFQAEAAAARQPSAGQPAEHDPTHSPQEQRQAEHEQRARRRADREQAQRDRDALQQRRRDWAADLLREVWRHEPELAEQVTHAAAFTTVAGNLAAADEAGYDPREVLADLPTSTLVADRVRDPARMTAWSIDHAVERLRTGEVNREHAQAAELAQMREQAAELLVETWTQHPELAETVIASPAFDAFVARLDAYTEAGLDPRALLEQINVGKLADPAIRDVGAFATYALRRVGDHDLDERAAAEQYEAEREERAARREQAAETVREVWNHAPDSAERLIADPDFAHFEVQLATAQQAGWDAAELLAQINPAQIDRPQVVSRAGAATFVLKRVVEHAESAEAHRAAEQAAAPPLSTATREQLLHAARRWAAVQPAVEPSTGEPAGSPETDPGLDRLAEVNDAAAQFYAQQLDQRASEHDYLADRVPDVDYARTTFTLGYAPNDWRAATQHLLEQGWTEQDLLDAGVSKRSSTGGCIDRMRGRLVLGVRDEHGRLAGWIGRDRTGDPNTPKYLNSPGTALYDKSRIVFGLSEQQQRLAAGAVPVLVEGTFDVLALATSEAGAHVVPVTTSGTAVTTAQLDALTRVTGPDPDLVIGLDGDDAGQAAAARAVQRALPLGIDPRVIVLPDSKDPADWVQDHRDNPDQAAAPYLSPDQQQPGTDLVADRALQDYFAAHPAQHRDEVEGQLGAARSALSAIAAADRENAVHTGLRLAEQLHLDPTMVMSMLADRRAAAANRTTPPPLDPTTADTATSEPAEHEQHPDHELAEHPPEPTPVSTELAPQPPLDAAASARDVERGPVPHWSAREHGRLADTDLDARMDTAQRRLHRTEREHDQARTEAQTLRAQVETDQGPEVAAVEDHLGELREQATRIREAEEVETSWQATVERAATAAEERARAEHERDHLGWFARTRRADLDARIAELAHREQEAHTAAGQLAERAGQLQQQTGDREQRRRTLTRANAAEADHPHARDAAQRRDVQAADAAERRTARIDQQRIEHEHQVQVLADERQLRAELSEQARELEQQERVEALQPAEATISEHEIGAGEPAAGIEQIEHQAQIEQESTEPEPGDPEV